MPTTRCDVPRLALATALAVVLAACGKTDQTPAALPPNAPTPAASVSASAPTTPLPPIALNCDDASTAPAGEYLAENNAWGKGGMVGWSQCMGAAASLKAGAPGGVAARWTWDWRHEGDHVKAYPEVVFGHKPGYPKSTTPKLPRVLNTLQHLRVDYEVHTEREGAGNMAIDMWLTHTANPTTFAVPPISHEVMIWLEVFGPMYAGGQQVDKVRIHGTMYRVYVGEKFGLGWRYVAFAPNSPMQTSAQIDLMAFFEYLKAKNLVTGQEHLAAVNLGNELISGAGETELRHFAVDVR